MAETRQTRGMYFEEMTVGDTTESPARTITEADIMLFAGLSGDYNPLHTDAEYAKTTIYGERVAHGLLSAVDSQWPRLANWSLGGDCGGPDKHRLEVPRPRLHWRHDPISVGDWQEERDVAP